MKKLRKDLQAVGKEFEVLAKKTKKLTGEVKRKAAYQLERARAAVRPEVTARRTADALKSLAKTMDKAIKAVERFAKEQVAKKPKPGVKATRKAPAKKTAAVQTATDQVLKIIKRSKKGVDVQTLIKKTGFEDKKIRNILFTASKLGFLLLVSPKASSGTLKRHRDLGPCGILRHKPLA